MIRFKVDFTSAIIDIPILKDIVQDNLTREMKRAALNFAIVLLDKIPTYNPPEGGRNSIYSTGFVAGSVINIIKAVEQKQQYNRPFPGKIGRTLDNELAETLDLVVYQINHVQITPELKQKIVNRKGLNRTLDKQIREKLQAGKQPLTIRERSYLKNLPSLLPIKKPTRIRTLYRSKGRSILLHNSSTLTEGVHRVKINPYYGPKSKGILKTPLSAAEHSELVDQPKDIFTINGNKVTFKFYTNISYFNIEDVTHKHSGPWRAYEEAREAFYIYMHGQSIIKRLFPKLDQCTIRYLHKVDFNGKVTKEQDKTSRADRIEL